MTDINVKQEFYGLWDGEMLSIKIFIILASMTGIKPHRLMASGACAILYVLYSIGDWPIKLSDAIPSDPGSQDRRSAKRASLLYRENHNFRNVQLRLVVTPDLSWREDQLGWRISWNT